MADDELGLATEESKEVEKSPYLSNHSGNTVATYLSTVQHISQAPSVLVKRTVSTAIVLAEPVEYSWLNINVFSGACIQKQDGSFTLYDQHPSGRFMSKMFNTYTPPKHILRNVTGVAKSGKILALMGSSGAGKTTLMNLLMFRTSRKLKICGDRFVNGVSVGSSFMNAISGYVQQDDLFLGALTVKEHLTYQAVFRMERQTTSTERELRVIDVITDCGLQKCMNTRIGSLNTSKGISGGERKRLSFASEIITDPSILFCDEPTSGLDNHTAQNIVHILKKMALSGKTIICTIHQPSSDIFSIFHDILLMAEGRTAYLGPREDALQFFAEQGMECPVSHNPADYFLLNLSVLTFGTNSLSHEEKHQIVEGICDYYEDSTSAKNLKVDIINSDHRRRSKDFAKLEHKIQEQEKQSEHKATNWNQIKALVNRALATNWRNVALFGIRVTQLVVVACIFVLIYYRQDMTEIGIRNINGALFLFIVHMTFSSVFGVINTFCEELPLFMREQSDKLYRTSFYFISKTVADLPLHFLFPIIFASIVYFAIGLKEDIYNFFWCVFILTLVVNVSCSFGYAVSCGAGNVQTALTLIPPLTTPLLIFGGVFVDINGVSPFLSWIQYISWVYYSTEAILLNQWEYSSNNTIKHCKIIKPSDCKASEFGLQGYNFNHDNFQRDIVCLCVLVVGFRLIAYIALQLKVRLMTRFQ